jgi:hypothetical protein
MGGPSEELLSATMVVYGCRVAALCAYIGSAAGNCAQAGMLSLASLVLSLQSRQQCCCNTAAARLAAAILG